MNFMNKRRALVVAMAACPALASGTSFAQAWPAKPVRIVTAFAAGSASDIVARLYAQELQADLLDAQSQPLTTAVLDQWRDDVMTYERQHLQAL